MTGPASNFDRLAAGYRLLEWLAFGADLEATRFAQLDALRGCSRVLILGEGDGRFLARLARRFPGMRVECVDFSQAMLARAQNRLTPPERERVIFRHEDARDADLGANRFDAVVTLFFLDCFPEAEAARLVAKIGAATTPTARWLWADFEVPESGWRRARARAWVGVLYFFFRWQTRLAARRLPPVKAIFRDAGWTLRAETRRQSGLLRSAVFERRTPGPGDASGQTDTKKPRR